MTTNPPMHRPLTRWLDPREHIRSVTDGELETVITDRLAVTRSMIDAGQFVAADAMQTFVEEANRELERRIAALREDRSALAALRDSLIPWRGTAQ